MLNELQEMTKTLDGFLASLDPAVLHGCDAARLLEATVAVEQRLLEASKRQSFKQLRRTCANERASQRSTERDEARHARIHAERFHKSWTDAEGAYCYEGRNTAAVGARIEAAVAAEADRVFKARLEGGPGNWNWIPPP